MKKEPRPAADIIADLRAQADDLANIAPDRTLPHVALLREAADRLEAATRAVSFTTIDDVMRNINAPTRRQTGAACANWHARAVETGDIERK